MPARSSRARILQAARTAFERDGLPGLSMRKIAQAVGLTPMAIYRHYADKDALIDALALDGLDRWRERLEAIEIADPMAWLEQMGSEFLDYALEEPRRFEAAFLLPARSARQYPDDFAAGRSPPGQLWLARLEAAKASGDLRPDVSSLEVGFTLWGLGQGLITLHRAGRLSGGIDEFRQFYSMSIKRCLASFAAPGRYS